MTIDDTLEWRGSPNISGEFFFKINKAIIYPRFNVEFVFFFVRRCLFSLLVVSSFSKRFLANHHGKADSVSTTFWVFVTVGFMVRS